MDAALVTNVAAWVWDHKLESVALYALITAIGRPIQWLFERLGALAVVLPNVLREQLAERAIGAAAPWTFDRMSQIALLVETVTLQPIQRFAPGVRRLVTDEFENMLGAVDATVTNISKWVSTFATDVQAALGSGQQFLGAQVNSALSKLGDAPSQRVFGSVLFSLAVVLFLWADAGLSMQIYPIVITGARIEIPPILSDLALQLLVSSVVSVVLLFLILFDLMGLTHVGPWSQQRGANRWFWVTAVTIVFVLFLGSAAAQSAVRANSLQPILDEKLQTQLAFWSVMLTPPLMLIVSGLAFVGALDFPEVARFLIATVGWALMALVRLVITLLLRSVIPFAGWVTGLAARVVLIVGITVVVAVLGIGLGGLTIAVALAIGIASAAVIAAVLSWRGFWVLMRAALMALSGLLDRASDLLSASVEVITYVGVQVWNWVNRFPRVRAALRILPIGPAQAGGPLPGPSTT